MGSKKSIVHWKKNSFNTLCHGILDLPQQNEEVIEQNLTGLYPIAKVSFGTETPLTLPTKRVPIYL